MPSTYKDSHSVSCYKKAKSGIHQIWHWKSFNLSLAIQYKNELFG